MKKAILFGTLFLFFLMPILSMELPLPVRDTLSDHNCAITQQANKWASPGYEKAKVEKFTWLDDYYIKYGIERVANADKLKNFIKKHNIKTIDVTQKYIYQYDKFAEKPNNNNSVVIAEEKKNTFRKLSLKEMQDLYYLTTQLPYTDCHDGNVVINDKVYIVDTDNIGFDSQSITKTEISTYLKRLPISLLFPYTAFIPPFSPIYHNLETINQDKEAKQWLNRKKNIYYAKHICAQLGSISLIYYSIFNYFKKS